MEPLERLLGSQPDHCEAERHEEQRDRFGLRANDLPVGPIAQHGSKERMPEKPLMKTRVAFGETEGGQK